VKRKKDFGKRGWGDLRAPAKTRGRKPDGRNSQRQNTRSGHTKSGENNDHSRKKGRLHVDQKDLQSGEDRECQEEGRDKRSDGIPGLAIPSREDGKKRGGESFERGDRWWGIIEAPLRNGGGKKA